MPRATPVKKLPKRNPWNDQSEGDAGQPKQTIVPAGTAAPAVKNTAANSVFALAAASKPQRKRLPELDVSQVAIITGATIPPSRNTRAGSPYQALVDKMKKGDSVKLPERYAQSLATHMRGVKIKVTVRNLGGGTFGVWRLS